MNEIISQINKSIETKANSLKKLVNENFDSISDSALTVGSNKANEVSGSINSKISNILYTGSAVLAGGAVGTKLVDWIKNHDSDNPLDKHLLSKLPVGLSLAALCSAAIGFVKSRVNNSASSGLSSSESVDIDAIKNDVISKGIASVKDITNEWEEFMEKNQKDIFASIDSSSLSDNQKDDLTSKVFSYEVIDVNLSELMSMVNSAISISEIEQKLQDFRSKLLFSIDKAVGSQIAKYDSLQVLYDYAV